MIMLQQKQDVHYYWLLIIDFIKKWVLAVQRLQLIIWYI